MDTGYPRTGRVADLWTNVNGWRVYGRISEEPPSEASEPLVLVPGLNVSSRHTLRLAELLAPYVRVYALDLPGCGKSDKPRRFLTLQDMTEVVAAWMSAAGLGRAAIFGTSFSAQIVANFATRYPERVTRAILASPTVDPSSRPLHKLILRWRRNERREPPIVGSATKRDYQDVSQLRAIYTLWQMVHDHIEARLPHVQVPVLVARGDGDPIISQEWAEQMVRLLPDGRLVVIPGGFHAMTLDAPEKLAEAIHGFLREKVMDNAVRPAEGVTP